MELFAEYAVHGWALCPIAPGRKSPVVAGWQRKDRAIRDPDVAAELSGVGLCHAWSGTCALDIDDFAAAADWCAMQGIDLHGLWNAADAVRISSGKPNRGKLLYKLPAPLQSKKIVEGSFNIIDFRCATGAGTSAQDVLPGTVHPDTGKPYAWDYADTLVGDWRYLPDLPANVRTAWEALLGPTRETATDAPLPTPTGATADLIRQVMARKDPDCDRDSWVLALSKLHHETKGSDEGLALADEWSRRGKKYAGFEDVHTRWRSFSTTHVAPATMQRDIEMRPADADEFGPVAAPPEATPEEIEAAERARRAENKAAKRMAINELEAELVFISSLDKYFSVSSRETLAGDHALRHLYTGRMPYMRNAQGKRVKVDPVNVLKESVDKQIVNAPGFHPGEGLFFGHEGSRYINEFQPIPVELLPPTPRELSLIEWLFNRIDDPKFREWLKQFYAHAVQRPGVKILSAPLIWSTTTGNGKSALLEVIPLLLFGQRYSQSVSHGQLASDFNDYLAGKWFIHMSEMHADARGERNKVVGKLKQWITDPLSINVKGSRGYTTRNNLVITAASNKPDAAAIDNDDRRWAIHEMTAPQMTELEGRELFDKFLRTPRAAGVLRHYFLNFPITDFVATAPAPVTESRQEMVMESLPAEVGIIHEAVEEGRGPFGRDIVHMQEVMDFLKQQGFRLPTSPHRMARVLKAAPLGFDQIRPDAGSGNGTKLRLWVCRNHRSWELAPAKNVVDHWQGEVDPLTT